MLGRSVKDGLTGSRKHPVRLANVNAAEKGTKGGAAAKKALQDLIGGKEVSIADVPY